MFQGEAIDPEVLCRTGLTEATLNTKRATVMRRLPALHRKNLLVGAPRISRATATCCFVQPPCRNPDATAVAWPCGQPAALTPQKAARAHHLGMRFPVREALTFSRCRWLPAVASGRPTGRTHSAGALLVGLAGCASTDSTDTADVFPMNAAAQRLGPVQASFVRTGAGRGPVTITMADGEVLTGEYRVAFSGSVGTAFAGPWTSSAIVVRDGPVQFVARGPKTQMRCRGTSTPMGHGNGECQTFEGAVWAISW
jgi:hypothetical protein